MNAVSLFSGVGMFDLGVSLAGYDIIAQVEIDDYCREVLKRHAPTHWPNATRYVDVRQFGRDDISGPVDLIFGGFPCQPFSAAGSRQGAADNRNLWPEFCRIVGELQPAAVILENVPRITQSYTIEDKIQHAYALTVIADLATMGYDAQWGIISAADAGAPHQRDRWWCVAYAAGAGSQKRFAPGRRAHAAKTRRGVDIQSQRRGFVADPNSNGRRRPSTRQRTSHKHRVHTPHQRSRRTVIHASESGCEAVVNARRAGLQKQHTSRLSSRAGYVTRRHHPERRNGRTQPGLGRAAHGITRRLDAHWPAYQGQPQYGWEAPRTAPKEAITARRARLKALGNGGIWWIMYHLARGVREELVRKSEFTVR